MEQSVETHWTLDLRKLAKIPIPVAIAYFGLTLVTSGCAVNAVNLNCETNIEEIECTLGIKPRPTTWGDSFDSLTVTMTGEGVTDVVAPQTARGSTTIVINSRRNLVPLHSFEEYAKRSLLAWPESGSEVAMNTLGKSSKVKTSVVISIDAAERMNTFLRLKDMQDDLANAHRIKGLLSSGYSLKQSFDDETGVFTYELKEPRMTTYIKKNTDKKVATWEFAGGEFLGGELKFKAKGEHLDKVVVKAIPARTCGYEATTGWLGTTGCYILRFLTGDLSYFEDAEWMSKP